MDACVIERHRETRLLTSLCSAVLMLGGCADIQDAAPPDHGRDITIVLDAGAGQVRDVEDAEIPQPCADRCADEFPSAPPCMRTSWDIKSCRCALRAVEDGLPCDDGLECTASDFCRAGRCEGGTPARLVAPPGGWAPEGTPLIAPGSPGWGWSAVHSASGCKSCSGALAYLHFVRNSGPKTLAAWAAIDADLQLVTMDVDAHLVAYDSDLHTIWEAPATNFAGTCVSRGLRFGPSGDLFATGWLEGLPPASSSSSWVARYSNKGELTWELSPESLCAGNDVLPMDPAGVTLLEACDGGLAADAHLVIRRLTDTGDISWTTAIDGVFRSLRTSFRLAAAPDGAVLVSYMIGESEVDPVTQATATRPVAFVARLTSDGAIAWTLRLSPPGYSAETGRIARIGSDSWAVAGIEFPSTGPRDRYPTSLWLIDRDGEIRRKVLVDPQPGDYFLVSAVEPFADGGILVAGYLTRYSGGVARPLYLTDYEFWETDGFLMKLDREGNYEWMRLYGGADLDYIYDVVSTASGNTTSIGVLGADVWPKTENWILRTDFWGRTCGMRLGVCADKSWQDCEDGNPCTINWCDPDEGCTAPPLPDGSPCGDGLTCQGAVCK
jgi:hypothetical protein